MQKCLKLSGILFALYMFLPITPSVAAIIVFTQSQLIDRNNDVLFLPQHSKRVIDPNTN